MKIYNQELQDGIYQLANSTRATCDIVIHSDYKDTISDELLKVVAKYNPSNPNQFDLYYLTCILASVGWNKNDDVFPLEDFWLARNTPEDKPFNFMHDEDDIIGHMTGAIVTSQAGEKIPDDSDIASLPNNLDIAVSAVLYKSWSNLEQLGRIKQIISEIENGEWCVSMECLFRNFDYALISADGSHKIVARNEQTSFLTKHLRCYGGNGEYEGNKVGRVLRNITFSGIGLVKRPANSRSIVLNTENTLGEYVMADTAKTAAEEVIKPELVAKLNDRIAELEAQLSAANDAGSAKATEVNQLNDKIKDLEGQLSSAKAEYDSVTTQLKSLHEKLRSMERKSTLASLDMDEDEMCAMLDKFKSMDDEAFAAAVSLAKCMKPKAEIVNTDATETTEAEEVEVEVEEVEASEIPVNDGDHSSADVQKAVSEWFSSILTTTKKVK